MQNLQLKNNTTDKTKNPTQQNNACSIFMEVLICWKYKMLLKQLFENKLMHIDIYIGVLRETPSRETAPLFKTQLFTFLFQV